jgi:hypothetical protein
MTKTVKEQTQMRKFKDRLFFIIDGNIQGSHFVGHLDERKGWSGEPFFGNSDKRKGSFTSNETHCLLGIQEQSGGAWWLEKLTSRRSWYMCPL